MNPIYPPAGRAGEYGDYAINIYTGCPHGCYYCYAAKMAKRWGKDFTHVEPRKGIVEAVKRQLDREKITGKLIHLCFTCDPYPTGYDTSVTRETIKILKEHGCHVQILTKGDGSRDFDLLDGDDWYGITLDGISTDTYRARLDSLAEAHRQGIGTWVSFEPVTDEKRFFIELHLVRKIAYKVKIGKLNYYPSDINWGEFGRKAEELCQNLGLDYYIKDGLRKEMEK